MYAIKMEDDKTLVTTVHATIYQGEKNADTLVFLVPISYSGISVADCTILLRYILPNGDGHSEELSLYPLPYSTKYYQYMLSVASRFTDTVGDIELWLTALNVDEDVVFKTSSTIVTIDKAKNIEDYLSEADRDQLLALASRVNALQKEKADSLTYDGATRRLSLTSNGVNVGEAVTVPADGYSGSGGGDVEWDDMGGSSGGDSSGGDSSGSGSSGGNTPSGGASGGSVSGDGDTEGGEEAGEGDIPWEDM